MSGSEVQLAPSVVDITIDVGGTDCLLYIRGNQAKSQGYLKFGALKCVDDEVIESNMHTKFYLDPPNDPPKEHGDQEFVHLRCAYNNKYLVAIESEDKKKRLMGTADELEEDLSKESCTLFRVDLLVHQPDSEYNQSKVRFLTPGGHPVGFYYSDKAIPEENVWLNDAAGRIIMPVNVAFKGDNSLYLKVDSGNDLQFSSSDVNEASARFAAFNYARGRVRIKSVANRKFLRLSDDNKWVYANATEEKSGTVFKLFKFSGYIALQPSSLAPRKFCISKNQGGTDWLGCGADSITEKAKLRLEEPIIAREIYNVQYHRRDHSRIYDTTKMTMVTASAVNRTSEKNTVKSTLAITTRSTSKWESTNIQKVSASLSLSAKSSVNVLGLENVEFGVTAQFGYEASHSSTWGTSSETAQKQEIQYEVTVPANKMVPLTVTAKQAKYDVPFSYTQKDTLPNGEIRIYNYDDGLYSGMNCFDLHYETKEEEIIIKEEEMETPLKKRKAEVSARR